MLGFMSQPGGAEWVTIGVVNLVMFVIPLWKVFGKAGFRRGWSLLGLILPGGILLLYVVAFARWPQPMGAGVEPNQPGASVVVDDTNDR